MDNTIEPSPKDATKSTLIKPKIGIKPNTDSTISPSRNIQSDCDLVQLNFTLPHWAIEVDKIILDI